MKLGLYAGTFDPVHKGHIDVAKRASEIFDKVILLVGYNPSKKHLFTAPVRVAMLSQVLAEEKILNRFVIDTYSGMLCDYLSERYDGDKITLVRGVRPGDFDSEFARADFNFGLGLDSIFIPASKEHQFLSSSSIKELVLNKASSEILAKAMPSPLIEQTRRAVLGISTN
jgi:pantetheine-phosphate adenylyltransferase